MTYPLRVTDPPGLGGGGIEQGPGTAIADNRAVRGDTTGIQGSGVTISDTAAIVADSLVVYPLGVPAGDKQVQIAAETLFAADVPLRWYNDSDISSGSADSGIVRSAAGTLKVTDGGAGNGRLMIGGSVCRGFTTSAGAPGTTQFPNDKDWGFHRNSGTGDVYVSFNDGGVVKSVLLEEII